MTGAGTGRMTTDAFLSTQSQRAIVDAEARALARVCSRYGVLTRRQLVELAGTRHWSRGRFADALSSAVDAGLVRDLGFGFYASPRPTTLSSLEVRPISFDDMALAQSEFERLLELRTGLRKFLRWSEEQARAAGLTPAKHQLLLAVKGHPEAAGPAVGDVANHLVLRHHSAVELIDRAEAEGLVRRDPDSDNKSVVRVTLTPLGEEKLDALSKAHVQELAQLAPTMNSLWKAIEQADGDHPAARPRGRRRRRA
jgi:DNA-binding MarR family transcriptional regulator